MKPVSKAPGTKRLKQEYDELLLNVACIRNLRRYIVEQDNGASLEISETITLTSNVLVCPPEECEFVSWDHECSDAVTLLPLPYCCR